MTDLTATALITGHPLSGVPTVGSLGVNTKIRLAFMAQLAIYVAENPINIAYSGIAFQPVSMQPYLRAAFSPSATKSFDLKSVDDYTGIFQIDVMWPIQQGLIAPLGIASALRAFFPRGSTYHNNGLVVTITLPSYISSPMQDSSWLCIPVNIPYRAFT